MLEPLNRDDPAVAEAVMKALCPSARDRLVVLGQLVASATFSESLAPHSWSVTLRHDSFRLNVGPVEALTFGGETARLLLSGEPSTFEPLDVEPIGYKSVPSPQTVLYASAKELAQFPESVREAHRNFIRSAAISASGRQARSKFANLIHLGCMRMLCGWSAVRHNRSVNSDAQGRPRLRRSSFLGAGYVRRSASQGRTT